MIENLKTISAMNKIYVMSFFLLFCASCGVSNKVDNKLPTTQLWAPRQNLLRPLVVFVPGLGMAVESYSAIINNIVGHGYPVLGVNLVTESSMAQEKQLERWAGSLAHLLDNITTIKDLKGYDTSSMVIIGHSLGGTLALHMCRSDNRFKAGISMDGGVDWDKDSYKVIDKPFMFLLKDPELDAPSAHRLAVWNMDTEQYKNIMSNFLHNITMLCNNKGNKCSVITIPSAGHNSFSDVSLLDRDQALNDGYDVGSIDGKQALDLINARIITFLDNLE